ncbi:MAG: polysaccharide biosynthesis/export family protein [Bacteroidota bacterium]
MVNSRFMRFTGLLCFVLFVLSSCSYKNKNTLFKTSKKLKSDNPISVFGQASSDTSTYRHRIKPGDRLQIRFLNNFDIGQAAGQSATSQANRDINTDKGYLVNYDSTVTLPLIGRINLAGQTRLEAAKNLENKYAEWGIINPIIDLNIASLSVTVLGEVESPGKILLDKENTSLVDALAMAGGLIAGSKKSSIKIIRGKEIILVNLKLIDPLYSPAINLQDNDIVYVEPYGVKATLEPISAASTGVTLLFTGLQALLISVQLFYLVNSR